MRARDVALLRCRAGAHRWERLGTSLGYGDRSEHTEQCAVCGQQDHIVGDKVYGPPYYDVTRTTIRDGDLSELEHLGLR